MKTTNNKRALVSVGAALFAPILFGLAVAYTGTVQSTMEGSLKVDGKVVNLKNDNLKVISTAEFSWFSAILNIGCMFGSLVGGQMCEKFGRRRTLVMVSPLYVLSWIMIAMSSAVGILCTARGILGLAVGCASVAAPMYIGEISPDHLRGALGACNQLSITFGIMLMYLLGILFKTEVYFCSWRYMTAVLTVPAVLLFIGMAVSPESPRWLASKGRSEQALKNLKLIRGGHPSDEEVAAINQIVNNRDVSTIGSETLADCKPQLAIGIVLQSLQQFTGINAVVFFMTKLFEDSGVTNGATWSFVTTLIQVVFTFVACLLMDRVGRRRLLIAGASGLSLSVFFMGLANYLIVAYSAKTVAWLFILSLCSYMAFFSLGVGPIPWLILAEIFPDSVRSQAASIATTVNWTSSFLVTFFQSSISAYLQPYMQFWLYAVFAVGLVVFTYFAIPETKGKSLEDIQAHFKRQKAAKPDSTRV